MTDEEVEKLEGMATRNGTISMNANFIPRLLADRKSRGELIKRLADRLRCVITASHYPIPEIENLIRESYEITK